MAAALASGVMLPATRSRLLPFVAAIILAACGGGNTASQLAKAPDFNPKDQTQCSVEKSQAKPLIVEWPSADRGELESQAHNRGVVVVRYQGCEMQVLDGCTVPISYAYTALTRKKDRVQMRDADDLYANIPVGAARFEAKLQKSGELDVDMTMVGRWEAGRRSVRPDELQGTCDGATHIVAALTVGAFTFTAGADATVGGGVSVAGAGGGAQSSAQREMLNADGDESACEKSLPDDKAPPPNCGAMLRLEVVPLFTGSASAALHQEVQKRMLEIAQMLSSVALLQRALTCPQVPKDSAGRFSAELDAASHDLTSFNQQALNLLDPIDHASPTQERDLGSRLDELKDQIRRAHTRFALLSDTVLGGKFTGHLDDAHPCGGQ